MDSGDTILVVILLLLSVVTVFGNILVILAVLLDHRLQNRTNFLITNLAVSDFFQGALSLPLRVVESLNTGSESLVRCDIVIGITVLFKSASNFNLALIAIDRFFVIAKPFSYTNKMKCSFYKLIVAVTWLLSFTLFACPVFGWRREASDNAGKVCRFSKTLTNTYMVMYAALVDLFPLLIMSITYTYILHVTRKQIRKIRVLEKAVRHAVINHGYEPRRVSDPNVLEPSGSKTILSPDVAANEVSAAHVNTGFVLVSSRKADGTNVGDERMNHAGQSDDIDLEMVEDAQKAANDNHSISKASNENSNSLTNLHIIAEEKAEECKQYFENDSIGYDNSYEPNPDDTPTCKQNPLTITMDSVVVIQTQHDSIELPVTDEDYDDHTTYIQQNQNNDCSHSNVDCVMPSNKQQKTAPDQTRCDTNLSKVVDDVCSTIREPSLVQSNNDSVVNHVDKANDERESVIPCSSNDSPREKIEPNIDSVKTEKEVSDRKSSMGEIIQIPRSTSAQVTSVPAKLNADADYMETVPNNLPLSTLNSTKATKTLMAIMGFYILLSLPITIIDVLEIFCNTCGSIPRAVIIIALVMVSLNSAINAFVYGGYNGDYRKAYCNVWNRVKVAYSGFCSKNNH